MQIELDDRPYQTECINRVIEAHKTNPQGKALLVLPTGTGKTIVFSHIAKRLGLTTLIIAHRQELLSQAADKMRMIRPDAIIGQVGAGRHEYGAEITVASVQTISRPEHLKNLHRFGYGLVIIDECHHSKANGYQAVLDVLPDAFVLGVTATSDRLDKQNIEDIFGEPIFSASIIDMVQEGYLCDLRAIAIRTQVNLDDLHTQAGDYKVDELETMIDTPERNNRIVEAYQEHCSGRQALCFSVTVAHAWNLNTAFSNAGIASAVVSGTTPADERARILSEYEKGKINVVCNCAVLTEGYDAPQTSCIIMARPTQSRALYVQSIGRGTRLAPSKNDCIILDITDNCLKHRLEPQSLTRALGKHLNDDESLIEAEEREKREAAETRVRTTKDGKRSQDITINILERLDWQKRDNGMFVLEVGAQKHRIALVPCEGEEYQDMWGGIGYYSVWARLAPMFEPQMWVQSAPLDWCQSIAEKRARLLLSDAKNVVLVDRNAPWRSYGATDRQKELLTQFRVQFNPDTITKGEASDILDPIFEKLRKKREAKERVS